MTGIGERTKWKYVWKKKKIILSSPPIIMIRQCDRPPARIFSNPGYLLVHRSHHRILGASSAGDVKISLWKPVSGIIWFGNIRVKVSVLLTSVYPMHGIHSPKKRQISRFIIDFFMVQLPVQLYLWNNLCVSRQHFKKNRTFIIL